MENNGSHITEYKVLVRILLILLFCTFLTIEITSFNLAAFTVTVALLIAGFKSYLVLSYFMHLKYESLLLKILVSMVFVLFIVIVLITFIDYSFR
ncbi:MAG: cytochrome C oxidase subunit IV family protein [Bacteroidales bacterium]